MCAEPAIAVLGPAADENVDAAPEKADTGRSAAPSLADRQLRWAYQRTAMAFERTFAAWIRTGLAALAFGIAFNSLRAAAPGWLSRLAESGLILFGALCFVVGLHRLRSFAGAVTSDDRASFRLLTIMTWILIAASIAALVSIWAA
jgi:putative membrane protein